MKKEILSQTTPTSIIKSTCVFFNSNLSYINDERLRIKRARDISRYLTKCLATIRDIAPLYHVMGVMSFLLYQLRFLINLCQLILFSLEDKPQHDKDLYFSLFNDFLWSNVNLIEFFWWTFNISNSAGFRGMQLEALAQLIDVLVMIVRHEENKKEYLVKVEQNTGIDLIKIKLDWYYQQLNYIRSCIAASLILISMFLYAFSIILLPLSLIIFSVSLTSSITRLLFNIERNNKIIDEMDAHFVDPLEISEKKRQMKMTQHQDLNQLILYYVFVPTAILLFIAAQTIFLISGIMAMFMMELALQHSINLDDSVNEPIALGYAA